MTENNKNNAGAFWAGTIILTLAGLIFLYTKIKYLQVPLDRDEGTYLYMGRLFVHGYRPYIDFYEIKPPGIFLVYGIFDLLFGWSIASLHIGIAAVQCLTGYLVYRILQHSYGNTNASFTAVAVYLILLLYPNFQGFAVLSENLFILTVLLSVFFLQKTQEGNWKNQAIASGLFLGLAAMVRQHAVFFVIPLGYLLMVRSSKTKSGLPAMSAYFLAGLITMAGLLVLYVSIRGGFDQMLYWVFTRPSEGYASDIGWDDGKRYLTNYLKNLIAGKHWPLLIMFVSGIVMVGIEIVRKKNLANGIFLLLFFIASFACIFPGFRFYGHYWLMVFPAIGLLAGCCLLSIRSTHFLWWVLPIAMALLQAYINKDVYFRSEADNVYRVMYDKNPNRALHKVIQTLQRKLKAEDKVFVFGSEPQVYYLTDKAPSIPHVYLTYVHTPNARSAGMQEEVISYLKNQLPDYIVHVQNPISLYIKEESDRRLYNWIFRFETGNYTPVMLAETDDDNNPRYYYDREANKNPEGSNYIVLYKRNP